MHPAPDKVGRFKLQGFVYGCQGKEACQEPCHYIDHVTSRLWDATETAYSFLTWMTLIYHSPLEIICGTQPNMSYYDVDSILTDAQKLPCTFELEVPGLGILEGNPGENIKAGTRIDLPLWLGVMLSIGARLGTSRLVTLDLPPALSDRVMNALKADPRSVDLRSLAPHFYNLSERVLDLFEEEEMVDVLVDTFKKRAAVIADHAHNPQGALGNGADFLRGLDETERQLFRVAHDGAKQTRIWAGETKKR